MLPRLIASDLDGTLLGPDRNLTPRTIAAVRAAVAAGIEFVLVTARPPRTVSALADQLGGQIVALCSNGAIVTDFGTGKTDIVRTFTADDGAAIIEYLRAELPEAGLAVETGWEVYLEESLTVARDNDQWQQILTADLAASMRAAPSIVKILARSALRTADEMVEIAERTLKVPAEISHAGGRGLLEIGPVGASKASGLQWLCADRGIDPAEVVAFGDMPNDLTMLRWAGVGHAVANAHPRVLAAADQVIGHHAKDGVAAAIEALLSSGQGRPPGGETTQPVVPA
jgi:Cof subfamily protein (haloacid dehalogenase superfamily)